MPSQQRFSPSRLRELRERACLSREQVAVGVNRSVASVGYWETGRTTPPTDVVADLAWVLGCELGELFEEADRASA